MRRWREFIDCYFFPERACGSIGPNRFPERESHYGRQRRHVNVELVFEQCNGVYCLGRMVGQHGDERHAGHRFAHRQCELHTNLHRRRRHGRAIRDRLYLVLFGPGSDGYV